MVNKDISIMELLQTYPMLIDNLKSLGMGCSNCMGAMTESLEQGIKAHGLNVEEVLTQLNTIIKQENISF